MNFMFRLLAQAEPGLAPIPGTEPAPDQTVPKAFLPEVPIEEIWESIASIGWEQAVGIVAFGMVYLLYGWRLYRLLVVINYALIGIYAGRFLGQPLGSTMWGGLLGCFMLGVVSRPFMRYSVSLLGALAGAVLGAAIWRTIPFLPDPLIWVGGLAGIVAGGFLAFSSFSLSVMLFTSLQGAAAIMVGLLALLNHYPGLNEKLTDWICHQDFFVPVLLLLPSLIGIILQGRILKTNSGWKMPDAAKAG